VNWPRGGSSRGKTMKFSTKEDIEAGIEFVFDRAADYRSFERSAMRRGIEVRRTVGEGDIAKGSTWEVEFVFRGKPRHATIQMTYVDHPNSMNVFFQSGGIDGDCEIDLVSLSPNRTRMGVQLEIKPRTLAARLMLQSMKLARQSLVKKFKTRVADFAEEIEEKSTGR